MGGLIGLLGVMYLLFAIMYPDPLLWGIVALLAVLTMIASFIYHSLESY